ncbi:hypothetical protein DH2020_042787 [Rehmannia glutinosa]|uniref:Alpha/beta hydrolase fold-3 domain-containing protein n=1 Tax=Rehmannia glutinosa TaxID=99300 RepID=A0ABR0UMF1_REHGL
MGNSLSNRHIIPFYILRTVRRPQSEGSSSSVPQMYGKKLWEAFYTGQILHFAWRILTHSLPTPSNLLRRHLVSTSDVPIDPSRNLWLRLFVPNTTNPSNKLPLIVYFHGGGFNTFGPNSKCYDELCRHLAAKVPAVIASINYRLAPEHRYPCQYDDCYSAIKFIDDQKDCTFLPPNTDIKKCFVAGDSAGGNIAHHVTFRAHQNSHEFENMKIIGVLLVQPFFGGEERTESELRLKKAPVIDVKQTDWMWRMFLPEGADRDHRAVNVWMDSEVVNEMKGLEFPNVFVVVGGYDPLQDWQRRYVDGLKKCGKQVEVIEFPQAIHGFYVFPEVKEFDSFVSSVTKFIHKQCTFSEIS